MGCLILFKVLVDRLKVIFFSIDYCVVGMIIEFKVSLKFFFIFLLIFFRFVLKSIYVLLFKYVSLNIEKYVGLKSL